VTIRRWRSLKPLEREKEKVLRRISRNNFLTIKSKKVRK
jgi:hypothetical protein